ARVELGIAVELGGERRRGVGSITLDTFEHASRDGATARRAQHTRTRFLPGRDPFPCAHQPTSSRTCPTITSQRLSTSFLKASTINETKIVMPTMCAISRT